VNADESSIGNLEALVIGADVLSSGSQSHISQELADLAAQALEHERGRVEKSTEETYKYIVRQYEAFCDGHGLDPFHPASVRLYIVHRVNMKERKGTLRLRIAAIAHLARATGVADPTNDALVRTSLRNAMRVSGRAPRRVSAATADKLEPLVAAAQSLARKRASKLGPKLSALLGLRDRALVLFGFASGRRGSEIARVEVEHIEEHADGFLVRIPWSKTNKTGEPEFIGIPACPTDSLCPVAATKAWLFAACIESGPVFVTLSSVRGLGGNPMRAEDISRRLEVIAAEAKLPGFWRSHSLRRGVVTSAEASGVARSRTRTLTGWTSDAMFSVYADHVKKIAASPLRDILRDLREQKTVPK